MSYTDLTFEVRDGIAIATLNRPDTLNALNQSLREDMLRACEVVEARDDLRALIFTGAGRGFCSGADLSSFGPARDSTETSQAEKLDEFSWTGRQALAVYGMTKPTIAAVNGVAAGAGMSLALACDFRVGSPRTRFRTVFLEGNFSPDAGLTVFLPRIVGYSRAIDLTLTSRDVGADEAWQLGLLSRLVGEEELIEQSVALAQSIARWPPLAVRSTKRIIQQNLGAPLEDGLRNEVRGLAFVSKAVNDRSEALAARAEKRVPRFTGT